MVAYVIIPGIGGSDNEHWQSHWQRQWGAAAVRIEPASWDRPELSDWVEAVQRAVDEAATRDEQVVLVAHSLGCWAAAAWLNGADEHLVRAALLVAPPDRGGSVFPVAEAATFLTVEARALPCPSLVIASANDPYGSVESAEHAAAAWGSRLEVVGELGHLNSASGLGEWPRGWELLESLLSS
ncbi:alpha/beta hydrolase [Gryllotalpicola daejeonensis]|uniref:Alpha/beta hydrolase n=1 Tax=Gryllotalpicola daejeonensis TaxID=993087 RepID=A0ABP7ZJW2_9MICO